MKNTIREGRKARGLSQEELARYICTNKSTVTRHVTQLEENGYVERRPSESDRRVMRVYPTERMQALLPAVRRITETPPIFCNILFFSNPAREPVPAAGMIA